MHSGIEKLRLSPKTNKFYAIPDGLTTNVEAILNELQGCWYTIKMTFQFSGEFILYGWTTIHLREKRLRFLSHITYKNKFQKLKSEILEKNLRDSMYNIGWGRP